MEPQPKPRNTRNTPKTDFFPVRLPRIPRIPRFVSFPKIRRSLRTTSTNALLSLGICAACADFRRDCITWICHLPSAICHLRISACAGLCLFTLLACAADAPVKGATEGQPAFARFTLRDYLNRDWQNELVTFKLDPKLRGRRDLALLDGDQHPVPFQWQTGTNAEISFLASVPPLAQIEYRLVKSQWSVVSGQWSVVRGLSIKDHPDSVELGNEQIAIRLNRGTKGLTEGPIGGVRLASGNWVGAGELHWPTDAGGTPARLAAETATPLRNGSGTAAPQVRVLADGPVFAEVESE